MAQFAQFDPTKPAPQPVIGWFDTSLYAYHSLPPSDSLLAMTEDQWQARLADPNGWAVQGGALVERPISQPAHSLAVLARAALDASDMTAMRCFKAGVAFPAEWQAYCVALRAIVAGGSAPVLPSRPDFPAGT